MINATPLAPLALPPNLPPSSCFAPLLPLDAADCLAALTASGAPPTAGTGGRGSRPIREPRRPKANSIFPPAPAYSRVEDHLWPHPDPANGLLPGGHREHPSAG